MTQAATSKTVANGNAKKSDGFQKYVIDRPAFRPELFTKRDEKNPDKEIYTGLNIEGYPIAFVEMGKVSDEDGNERPGEAYIFLLTAPAKASNRDKEIVDVNPGGQLIVWANAQIKQAIPPAIANHPTGVLHIRIIPLYRAPMKNDPKRRMWNFDFETMADPVLRKNIGGGGASAVMRLLASLPNQSPTSPMLLTDGSSSDSDLPF